MTPTEQALQKQIDDLKYLIDQLIKVDKYQFERDAKFNKRVGFFTVTPVDQPDSGVGRQDVSDVGSGPTYTNTQYTGNIGTIGYSIGDIVYSLKILGLLKM